MRIVLVNWARFIDGALIGGGVNGYCHQLARELVNLGHRVAWLQSGLTYVGAGEHLVPPQVRRLPDEAGVEQYSIVNSPVVAPGIFQAHAPELETSCPELESLAESFFAHWKPNVVHFHNIEGFSAGCISSAVKSGAAVLYTLHNYHTVCSQVYLTRHDGDYKYPCREYNQGHACVSCLKSQLPLNTGDAEMRIRAQLPARVPSLATGTSQESAVEPDAAEDGAREDSHSSSQGGTQGSDTRPASAMNAPSGPGRLGRLLPPILHPALHKVLVQLGRAPQDESQDSPLPIASPVVSEPEVPMPGTPLGDPPSSPARTISLEQRAEGWGGARLAGEYITNALSDAAPSHRVLHAYGERRQAMIAALNQCHRVVAVSRFVSELYTRMGVASERLNVIPIGTRMEELAQKSGLINLDSKYPAHEHNISSDRRNVRLAFIGYNNYYKGLSMFLDSVDLLPLNISERLEVFIWAKDIESDRQRLDSMASRLGRLHVSGAYKYEDIPRMLSGVDAGVVPSLWWDNGPQTVMECLACRVPVIAAAVGGIVDWVRDGENGLLFQGNDRKNLAAVLTRIVTDPTLLRKIARTIQPALKLEEHVQRLLSEYRACLDDRASDRAQQQVPLSDLSSPGRMHGV
jgi:hypothetical protein